MLITLLIVLSSLFNDPDCEKMDQVRDSYGNIKTEEQLNAFISLLDSVDCKNAVPYLASATMQKAQFALAPWTKYRFFLRGKKMLEKHIKKQPTDIDARYIRFLVQTHAPFFLGYRANIDSDDRYIRQNIDAYGLAPAYKKQILNHLSEFNKK